ncbi:MAG: DEAD/DEAH box helicase [Candidatus Paceibacterota bacterium]
MSKKQSPIAVAAKIIKSLEGATVAYDPPASKPTTGEVVPVAASSLHPAVTACLQQLHPGGLFAHQHQAIENVLSGKHTVTATRTSSGKSLAFALPAFHTLCREPESTALFLYPQKALANDQLQKLTELARMLEQTATRLQANPMMVSRYDGNTPLADRKSIREQAQLLATNPDMLHKAILRHHQKLWARFFANLKLIAIDECHDYRGAFGTHVAMVLRRLRAICRIHGSDPVFTASSATIADPQQHLQRLTGLDFELVGPEMDRSRQGRRKIWVLDGNEHHHTIGRRLAVQLAQAGLRVLAFCPSRVAAEEMADRMQGKQGLSAEQIAVYRAGLTAEQREEIERGLKDGSKRLVFSTNALELGIDIGQLDVVVCIGLPATMMSLMQRAGRVARAGREGAIVLIPGNSPIDSYYAQRPEQLFHRDNEPIAISTHNEKIVGQHYAAAIVEHGNEEALVDAKVLGPLAERIQEARQEGAGLADAAFGTNDPHGEINLRSTGDTNFKLFCDGEKIGDIGKSQLLREAPRNALYRHGGMVYRVQSIREADRQVHLVREKTSHKTVSFVRKKLILKRILRRTVYEGVELATGILGVDEHLMTLTEKDRSGRVRNTWSRPGGVPRCHLTTEGTLIILKADLQKSLRPRLKSCHPLATESVERLLAGLFPTIAGPCDPQDFSSGTLTLVGGDPAIVLYDTAPNGIGLTEVVYRRASELIENALERVQSCQCEEDRGCIRCVMHPHQDSESSKSAALALLRELQTSLAGGAVKTWEADDGNAFLSAEPSQIECPSCQASVSSQANFCGNCGHKLEVSNV